MTNERRPEFARDGQSLPFYPVAAGAELPQQLTEGQKAFAAQQGFVGKIGQLVLLAGDGGISAAIAGVGNVDDRRAPKFFLASAAASLPEGTVWHWAAPLPEGIDPDMAALGWLLAGYQFTRYAGDDRSTARLKAPEGVAHARVEAMAASEYLTRDLINTPANDLPPQAIEDAARALAERHGAGIEVTTGDDLLSAGFPLIHAVGRAAALTGPRAPRLIDVRFKGEGPTLTLVGKGICFDTGGLNLKPGGSMGLMKKDMGGSACALGLAQLLAETDAPYKLRLLIPAAENAVAGDAFRPGDILRSRKGLSVEVNNTDAEGRLVLADALAYGAEDAPDLMISMATLTGAARVALGPDLPALFCDDDASAEALMASGMRMADPVWRLPLWPGYEAAIEPGIADLDNAPAGGMGGAITAALFLRRFAEGAGRYAHLDLFGWQRSAAPGCPKGGLGQGVRAVAEALPDLLK